MYRRCVMNDDQNVNKVNVQKMCNERWSKCKPSKCTKDV